MRTYAFAAIVAIAVGQEWEIEFVGEQVLPEAIHGDITGKGSMGEAKATFDEDNFFLMFWMSWETIWWNNKYASGSTMQNYAQWEEGAGEYGAFTCNLLNYDAKNTNWNSNVQIHNYSGISSMTNADGGSSVAWDGFGEVVTGEDGWFQADAETPQEAYKTVYNKSGPSTQNCAAWGLTYMQTTEEEYSEMAEYINPGYWMAKNRGATDVQTGWRYYVNGSVLYSADAGVASYTMADFGLVEPEPSEEGGEEEGKEEGDGASALISSAALALAAFLMF